MFLLNKQAQLVTAPADMEVQALERGVNKEGYTLGYLTEEAGVTLAQCLDKRLPNIFALKYGGIESLCVSFAMALKNGEVFKIKMAPRSATGPDLKKFVVGSEQLFGTFKEATLKIFPVAEVEVSGYGVFETAAQASEWVRDVLGWRIFPLLVSQVSGKYHEILRERVEVQTPGECVLFVLSGLRRMVTAEQSALSSLAEHHGGKVLWAVNREKSRKIKNFLLHSDERIKTEAMISIGVGATSAQSPSELQLEKRIKALYLTSTN